MYDTCYAACGHPVQPVAQGIRTHTDHDDAALTTSTDIDLRNTLAVQRNNSAAVIMPIRCSSIRCSKFIRLKIIRDFGF